MEPKQNTTISLRDEQTAAARKLVRTVSEAQKEAEAALTRLDNARANLNGYIGGLVLEYAAPEGRWQLSDDLTALKGTHDAETV